MSFYLKFTLLQWLTRLNSQMYTIYVWSDKYKAHLLKNMIKKFDL